MSYPQLLEDGTRLDWTHAQYSCKTIPSLNSVSVENILNDAPQLEELINQGRAVWQLEVRCPTTLYSITKQSKEPKFHLDWNKEDVRGIIYFFTGLYAQTDITLNPDGLSLLWQEVAPVEIPQGWELVRADMTASKTEADSLLAFKSNEGLPEGTMRVAENTSSGSLEFIIELAQDIYPIVKVDRTLQIAGLIAALGSIKGKEYEEAEPPYQALKNLFDQHGITPWDEDDYDPGLAATTIERFIPTTIFDPDGEEEE